MAHLPAGRSVGDLARELSKRFVLEDFIDARIGNDAYNLNRAACLIADLPSALTGVAGIP